MKISKALIYLIITGAWILLLSISIGSLPPLGKFLNPISGFWANAEPLSTPETNFKPLQADSVLNRVQIVFDERLVPHIKADNDADLYYAQGYVQAYYRLWQMEMQTRAAGGMLSEVAGPKALKIDRQQRRKGMVWAAEKFVNRVQKSPETKVALEAYTAGVNAYIKSIKGYKNLPLEYKLMDFQPQHWELINAGLLMKMMADGLTGMSEDLEMSYIRQALTPQQLNFLFPDFLKNSNPVIPVGTRFDRPSLNPAQAPSKDLFSPLPTPDTASVTTMNPRINNIEHGIGSNNWAVSGEKSTTGHPILCNDPHLNLNMPSIWFEIQLTAPGINCYGVTIPGAPGIVIGFNDSISWGFTNNYRDVKDYYALKLTEDSTQYWFDGQKKNFTKRVEDIYIKGQKEPFHDTVLYSIQGPVEYDAHFPDPLKTGQTLAMSWIAHQPSNELLALYKLNRAKNYSQFTDGVQHFECPAQNFIYADCSGNIAIWGQGRFVNKWKDQGKFVMRGDTSATLWKEFIPMSENPHVFNPPTHFLQSANQQVTDSTYPYYYNGTFAEFRSWEITHFLTQKEKFSIEDMQRLQNNSWSIIGEKLFPLFRQYGKEFGKKYPDYFQPWNDSLTAQTRTGAAFIIWWNLLYKNVWEPGFKSIPGKVYPTGGFTLDLLQTDTNYFAQFSDTPFYALVAKSFKQTEDSLSLLIKEKKTLWYQIKNTSVLHLAKLPAFSFEGLEMGGAPSAINAVGENHGPSWRMIVSMTPGKVEAWGTYPGGQSGNPGSSFYANFLEKWVKGDYYKLHFFHEEDYKNPQS